MDTQEKRSKIGVPGSGWVRLLLKAGSDLIEMHSKATANIKFGPKERQKKARGWTLQWQEEPAGVCSDVEGTRPARCVTSDGH